MARQASYEAYTPVPPARVMEIAGDPGLLLPVWPYTVDYSLGPPHRLRMRFRRFGFSMDVEYEVTVDREPMAVVYRGEAGDKRFEARIEAAEAPGGSRVKVTVSYTGPFESLSGPFVRDMAERIARALAALAVRVAGTGSLLADPVRVARILTHGRLLERRNTRISGLEEAQDLLRRVAESSRGRRVFARVLGEGVCVRLLADNGEIVDSMVEHGGGSITGPRAIEEALRLLPGRAVEVLLIEVPVGS